MVGQVKFGRDLHAWGRGGEAAGLLMLSPG